MKAAVMISALTAAAVAMAGEFHIAGGRVILRGSITADQITIDTGSTLEGSGTLSGNVSVGGDLRPDRGLTIEGDVLFISAGRLIGEIFGPNDLDQIICSNASGVCEVDYTTAATLPIIRKPIIVAETGHYGGFTPSDTDTWRLNSRNGTLLVTHLRMDVDSDGMPDWWEEDMLGHYASPLPNMDTDGDGVSNLDEFIALTDPMDIASIFKVRIESQAHQPLSFNTAPGRLYSIEVTDDLAAGWSIWTNHIPGTGSEIKLADPQDASNRFYRILVELEP